MKFTECFVIQNNREEPFQTRWSQRHIYSVTGRLSRIQSWETPRTGVLLPLSVFQGCPWTETPNLSNIGEGLRILSCTLMFVVLADRQIDSWIFFLLTFSLCLLHCSHTCTHKYTYHFFSELFESYRYFTL